MRRPAGRPPGRDNERKGDTVSQITTPRELFLHELGDIMYVENALANEVLPKLISEVTHEELSKPQEKHLEQTKGKLKNVEQEYN
jgi:ferritin-like metal-binding protein YciE